MKVSAVAITKNRIKDLRRCVNSLAEQTYPISELIIVDSSDNDLTKSYVEEIKGSFDFQLIYVRQDKGGTAKARNLGMSKAHGDIIIFVDDDVLLDRNCVRELISVFLKDKEERIGGVCPYIEEKEKISKVREILQYIIGILFFTDSWKKGVVTIAGWHSSLPQKSSFVEWLTTTCVAYRKGVVEEFKFDEKLDELSSYAYYEDLDLSYRVSRRYKLFLNARARVVHNRSPIRSDPFEIMSVRIQNHYYLMNKHGFSKIAFWWSIFGSLINRIALFLLNPSRQKYRELLGTLDGIWRIVRQ